MATKKFTTINSRLYSELFSLGGDSLVSVYVMLKASKNGGIKIYKEKNRNIYHTLKQKTGLSVTTLRKYIKVLNGLNLSYFDTVGNFVLVGRNKINERYKKKKFVIIQIGKNLTETKLYSFKVRLLRMETIQKSRIDRRKEQVKVKERQDKGYFLTKWEKKLIKNLTDKDLEYLNNKESFCAKTVLSNIGFSKLQSNSVEVSKSRGWYWKKRLVKSEIIEVKRRFKYLRKGTKKEYNQLRQIFPILKYRAGRIFEELTSEFIVGKFAVKENKIEKLDYLQFDFIHFLATK